MLLTTTNRNHVLAEYRITLIVYNFAQYLKLPSKEKKKKKENAIYAINNPIFHASFLNLTNEDKFVREIGAH